LHISKIVPTCAKQVLTFFTMQIKSNMLFFPDKEKDVLAKTGYKEDAKLRLRVRWGKTIVAFNVGSG